MKHRRMWEAELLGGDADIDYATGEGGVFEAGGHRLGGASGVDDHVGELTVRDGFEFGEVRAIGLWLDGVADAEVFPAEGEAALDHVHHDHVEVHEFQELQAGEADRSRADDEDGFTGLRVAALDGVVADGEGLDEGELVVGKVVSGVEFPGRANPGIAQAAVGVDAEDLHAGAAVRRALAAGGGVRVVDVGLQRALVAGLHVRHVRADREHFEAEFMAGDARVGKERHLSEVAREIGPADAHAMSADEGLARARSGWLGKLDDVDFLRLGELDRFHRISCFQAALRGGPGS